MTWNHLWYLAYLWVYTLVLLAVLPLRNTRPGIWLASSRLASGDWRGPVLIAIPSLYFTGCLIWLQPHFPETHALTDDWFAHAKYFMVFLLGFAIARDDGCWQHLDRIRWWSLGLALASLTLYLSLRVAGRVVPADAWPELPGPGWRGVARTAHGFYLWTALLAILAFGHRYLNKPFRWLPRANEAIYPWYILHQSLIVPLVFVLTPLALAGWLEVTLVLVGAVLGCLLIHELLIRRIALLRPLFGVPRRPRDSISGSAADSTSKPITSVTR